MAHHRTGRPNWVVVDAPRFENRATRRAELTRVRREARSSGQVAGHDVVGWVGNVPLVEVDGSGSSGRN